MGLAIGGSRARRRQRAVLSRWETFLHVEILCCWVRKFKEKSCLDFFSNLVSRSAAVHKTIYQRCRGQRSHASSYMLANVQVDHIAGKKVLLESLRAIQKSGADWNMSKTSAECGSFR